MSNRLSRAISVLVLALTVTFASSPFAAAMEPIVPNRSTGGAFGGSDSVVLACTPSFSLAEAVTGLATSSVSPGNATSMLLVEQDSGDVYIAAGQHAVTQETPVAQVAAAGCITPA
jgi:hypothetical protein